MIKAYDGYSKNVGLNIIQPGYDIINIYDDSIQAQWGGWNMPKGQPPVRLHRDIYEAWLTENPKIIEAGPVELEPVRNSTDDDAVNLPIYHVQSDVLPNHYADALSIFGAHSEFEGFELWVVPTGYDYLLMAHQYHTSGPCIDQNGSNRGNHPHFHEFDYDKPDSFGIPGKKRIIPDSLKPGMKSHEILSRFLDHYDFDDNRSGDVSIPTRNNGQQRKLHDYR
jgi:hypothetical protein